MNLPNSITLLRILSIPLLVFLLLSKHVPGGMLTADAVFIIVAVSDYVDGYLARRLNEETPLGKFLDPLADKILVLTALICLVELKVIGSVPVVIIVVRDLTVTALRLAAASSGRIIAAERLGKYKAAVLDIATAMLIVGMPYADMALWVGVALALISGTDYLMKNREVLYG